MDFVILGVIVAGFAGLYALLWRLHQGLQGAVQAVVATLPSTVEGAINAWIQRQQMAANGVASGEARREKSALADLARNALAGQAPLVGLGLDALAPGWPKFAAKNPALIPLLMQFLGKGAATGEPQAHNGNGGPSDFGKELSLWQGG